MEFLCNYKKDGAKLPRLNKKEGLYVDNIGKVIYGASMPQFGAIRSHNFLVF